MKTSDNGTPGISHTIHVGYPGGEGTVFEDIDEFENVVDALNLPNGGIKLSHEGGMEMISGARIIRSRVKGLEHAVRYRCSECQVPATDVISAMDRGETTSMECTVCETVTEFEKMGIEEI